MSRLLRNFRRLPSFLRIVWVVGLVFVIASGILSVAVFMAYSRPFPGESAATARLQAIALNLVCLGLVCTIAVIGFAPRLSQPDRTRFLLASWRRWAGAGVLAVALPLCAILLAVVIDPAQGAFVIVWFISAVEFLPTLTMLLLLTAPA